MDKREINADKDGHSFNQAMEWERDKVLQPIHAID